MEAHMTGERPFEMLFLPGRLRSDFRHRLPETKAKDPEKREKVFLRRFLVLQP